MFPDDDACWLFEMRWPDGFMSRLWPQRVLCPENGSINAVAESDVHSCNRIRNDHVVLGCLSHGNGINAQMALGSFASVASAWYAPPARSNLLSGLVEIEIRYRTKNDEFGRSHEGKLRAGLGNITFDWQTTDPKTHRSRIANDMIKQIMRTPFQGVMVSPNR